MIKFRFQNRYLSAAFFMMATHVFAQKQVYHEKFYWARLASNINLKAKSQLSLEIENHRFFSHNIENQIIFQTKYTRQLNKNVEIGTGLNFSWSARSLLETTQFLIVPERRIFQDINWQIPLSKRLLLSNRLGNDERFVRKNNKIEFLAGYNFYMRYRHRIQAQYEVKIKDQRAFIRLSNELMLQTGNMVVYNTFDQDRLSLSFEKQMVQGFSVELGYLFLYQHLNQKEKFYDWQIARVSLIKSF